MTRIKVIVIFLLAFSQVFAQEIKPAFWNDIQSFKKQDSSRFPARGQILFIGSSSFTKWTDVQNYFPSYPIINRGFGGSSLTDIIYYANDIIFPYQPKQIIIYCGENDLAASDSISSQTVYKRFKQLFELIRKNDTSASLAYISIKPSPARQQLMKKMYVANILIRNYLRTKKNTAFIDVYKQMLNADGTPMEDIFIEDKLHMNAKGYAIWQKIIEPYLLK